MGMLARLMAPLLVLLNSSQSCGQVFDKHVKRVMWSVQNSCSQRINRGRTCRLVILHRFAYFRSAVERIELRNQKS